MRNSLNPKSCFIGEYQETEIINSLRTKNLTIATAGNLTRMQNQRVQLQFWAPDDGRCVARNMLSN
jgi:hypothetical protein